MVGQAVATDNNNQDFKCSFRMPEIYLFNNAALHRVLFLL